jgi:transposase
MLIRKIVRTTLGIKHHRVVSVTGDEKKIVIELDKIKGHRLPCSGCGKRMQLRDRLSQREWRHVPMWNIPVFIRYRPARVRCTDCGIKVESIPWSNGKSSLTVPLSLTLASWAKKLPMKVVSEIFGVCWNTVYSAVKQVVAYGLSCRSKAGITTLGIDEISRKKGHTTVFVVSSNNGVKTTSRISKVYAVIYGIPISKQSKNTFLMLLSCLTNST